MRSWLVLLFGLLPVTHVFAFGFIGHKAICQAAYEQVAPQTRQRLDAIVAQQGEYDSFADSCSWADDIKHDRHWDWARPLHYVNVPRSAEAVTWADCPEQGCVLSGIVQYQKKLQEQPDDWQALFFLSHFIGDIHQPLHVSYADDLGGNRTDVVFFDEKMNLHAVWDFAMLDYIGAAAWKSFAKTLIGRIPPEQVQGDVLQWADQSLAITREIYSSLQSTDVLSGNYVTHYRPILERQMAFSAIRLAHVLDAIYHPAHT